MCYSMWYNAPTMLPAGGRQHRGCIMPQAVTHSLVLLKMSKIIAWNMLSWLELLINCYCCISLVIYIIYINDARSSKCQICCRQVKQSIISQKTWIFNIQPYLAFKSTVITTCTVRSNSTNSAHCTYVLSNDSEGKQPLFPYTSVSEQSF